jgi:hypothetical protein
MKTYKQYNITENGGVGPHSQATSLDANLNMAAIDNPKVVRSLNAFVGAIARQNFELPEQAINSLREKLMRVGLQFGKTPTVEGKSGSFSLPLSLYGGRFGKDVDTPHDEFLNDDGISNKIEGGLKINFNYEMQEDNSCKITASIK